MNDVEKRIAIAKATGQWKDCRIIPGGPHNFDMPVGKPLLIDGTFADEEEVVDNYPTDLNAMHEAENVLNEIQGCIFSDHLFRILNSSEGVSEFMKIHATSAQRAEAFLKTLDLWKP